MKPSIPQGTRDFSPVEVRRRQYILDILRKIFECYGFQPLETPAMEQLETLMGKYGEEGDRLIFKVLNNGLHEKKDAAMEKLQEAWTTMSAKPFSSPLVTERALRYDLTIPFARYVVMHQQDIAFPFRRYQMQPVWRADRPQRGRYREFWQCDCDVVGSNSLLNEAELLAIYRNAFDTLGIPQVSVKINSRKLLAALAIVCGAADQMMDITIALDKLDKVGWEGVRAELIRKNIPESGIAIIKKLITIQGTNEEQLLELEQQLGGSELGQQGIAELRNTLSLHARLQDPAWQSDVRIDISLARGLNYYTGIIMEVTTAAVNMGSIGGGGRYDDLTGLFGLKGISGVGISFGIDRIYLVMEELGLFPAALSSGATVLILNSGPDGEDYEISILQQLRNAGIKAELYPDSAKLDKQLKYANRRAIPYVIICGEQERSSKQLSLKNMESGAQQSLSLEECILHLLTTSES